MRGFGLCSRVLTSYVLAALVVSGSPQSVSAEAPAKVSGLATVDDLTGEAKACAERLNAAVASEEAFKKAMDARLVNQDAGVLACMAQGLVEHEGAASSGINATGLRTAALAARSAKDMTAAKAAVDAINAALKGEGPTADKEHPWNKLTGLGRMMEDLNSRQAKLRRVLRRPKDLKTESRDAAVMAVLALAMEADTHEVKKPEEIPAWQSMSKDYRVLMGELAAAMREGKADVAQAKFAASGQLCAACHEKFRD